jgi:hypothetical protein
VLALSVSGGLQGEAWMPYQDLNFVSPPFPDYPSGHSCFSASAVSIIRHLLGTDTVPRVRLDCRSLDPFAQTCGRHISSPSRNPCNVRHSVRSPRLLRQRVTHGRTHV